jgi:hypothetical protein
LLKENNKLKATIKKEIIKNVSDMRLKKKPVKKNN